ncbi:MAG: hypothetical protein PUP93_05165 [Rhizonema sp. NSF051]|nr:hypothetical protein [Rhizonema sp. NSF051]
MEKTKFSIVKHFSIFHFTEERQRAEGSYAEGNKFFKSPQPLSFQAPKFIYGTKKICPIETHSARSLGAQLASVKLP